MVSILASTGEHLLSQGDLSQVQIAYSQMMHDVPVGLRVPMSCLLISLRCLAMATEQKKRPRYLLANGQIQWSKFTASLANLLSLIDSYEN